MSQVVTILIIDDDHGVRQSLAFYLEDFGYKILSTESAVKALEIIQHTPVDVAIVDLRLGEMSGEVFILRAHASHPQIKYIIHTGSSDYTLSAKLTEIGMSADDIVYKPIFDITLLTSKFQKP